MILLAISATLRTVAVLLVLWWLLRMFMRAQSAKAAKRTEGPARPKGDVRIEPASRQGSHGPDPGIVDAEYEEIK